ncbi:hypothetical protein ACQP1W_26575 [Spirillospora sp. CA-255316]
MEGFNERSGAEPVGSEVPPNPLWRLMLTVGILGAVVLGLVGVLFLRTGPFAPAADPPVKVVVRSYLPAPLLKQPTVTGRPKRIFEYLDARPAAVLDVRGVDFGSRTFKASWYDGSGQDWGSLVSRRKGDFARPLPVAPDFIAPTGELTFVFGSWDPVRECFDRIYARTDIRLVKVR